MILNRNKIKNTKGGLYYKSTLNANLDYFSGASRFDSINVLKRKFKRAYKENRNLALKNLLHVLDIRGGKGERNVFKASFSALIEESLPDSKLVLNTIIELGRADYLLVALDTNLEDDMVELIKKVLTDDLNQENPSLLAKWMPSIRTHNKNNLAAKRLCKKLGYKESEYRKMLSHLRSKINIVEKSLTLKNYDKIDFEKVPSKAMLKYRNCFYTKMTDEYESYLEAVKNNKAKINANNLQTHEIIKKLVGDDWGWPWEARENNIISDTERCLLDQMWNNQENVLKTDDNILVVADTSGSMLSYNKLPISTSIGLAIYFAERNNGIYKNKFITFSSNPILQEISGKDIFEKVNNIKPIVAHTDIDKVFKLILNSAKNCDLKPNELPSKIILISDMEFDEGVYSKSRTNFLGWKKAFKNSGYNLPEIVFWNVAGNTQGYPVTKKDGDCIMVSGFSPKILSNLDNLEEFTPLNYMMETLSKYDSYIK